MVINNQTGGLKNVQKNMRIGSDYYDSTNFCFHCAENVELSG